MLCSKGRVRVHRSMGTTVQGGGGDENGTQPRPIPSAVCGCRPEAAAPRRCTLHILIVTQYLILVVFVSRGGCGVPLLQVRNLRPEKHEIEMVGCVTTPRV